MCDLIGNKKKNEAKQKKFGTNAGLKMFCVIKTHTNNFVL